MIKKKTGENWFKDGPETWYDRVACGNPDLGDLGDESVCVNQGCLFGKVYENSREPWCYHKFGGDKCALLKDERQDCSFTGSQKTCGCPPWDWMCINSCKCADVGCCWQPLAENQKGPWCFSPSG